MSPAILSSVIITQNIGQNTVADFCHTNADNLWKYTCSEGLTFRPKIKYWNK